MGRTGVKTNLYYDYMASENIYRAGVQHFLCHGKPLLLIQLQKCSGSLLKLTTGIVLGIIDVSYLETAVDPVEN